MSSEVWNFKLDTWMKFSGLYLWCLSISVRFAFIYYYTLNPKLVEYDANHTKLKGLIHKWNKLTDSHGELIK